MKRPVAIRCPICHKGRLIDAAPGVDISRLLLFGPEQMENAEWIVKCPKCGSQVGLAFRPAQK